MEYPTQITIIIAVHNGKNTLARAIESVINQTYPHKELIIMDGGSTDGSVDILKRYDDRIKYWESKPDRGIYHAWNKALEHAEGEWVCFIGCDDLFMDEDVLSKIVPKLIDAKKQRFPYAYGRVELYSDKYERVVEMANEPWKILKRKMRFGGFPVHTGSFHHRCLFESGNRFDEKYKICGDKDFIYRALKDRDAHFIDQVIVRMSMGGFSYNIEAKGQMVNESLLIWKSLSMPNIPWLLISSKMKVICYEILKKIFGLRFSARLADCSRSLRGLNPYWDQ